MRFTSSTVFFSWFSPIWPPYLITQKDFDNFCEFYAKVLAMFAGKPCSLCPGQHQSHLLTTKFFLIIKVWLFQKIIVYSNHQRRKYKHNLKFVLNTVPMTERLAVTQCGPNDWAQSRHRLAVTQCCRKLRWAWPRRPGLRSA